MNKALQDAVDAAGSMAALGRALGITRQAILAWHKERKIPADRIVEIEKLTGVARERLRPDLYRMRCELLD